MKRIIINETTEETLIKRLVTEEFSDWSEKVLSVKRYLDKKYSRPRGVNYVIEVNPITKEAVKPRTDVDVFYDLQDEFRDIIDDRSERDKFLKQVIKGWYRDKISKYGTLMES